MNKRIPLILIVITVLFSSCKKDLIGFKSKKKGVNVEEIDFEDRSFFEKLGER